MPTQYLLLERLLSGLKEAAWLCKAAYCELAVFRDAISSHLQLIAAARFEAKMKSTLGTSMRGGRVGGREGATYYRLNG